MISPESVHVRAHSDWLDHDSACRSFIWYAGSKLLRQHFANPHVGQQFILYLLFQFGSIQSVSLITLFIRRATFNKRFSDPPVYFPSLSDRKTRTEDLEAAEEVLNDPETGAQVHQGDDHDSASNTSGSSLANEKQSKEQTGNNASGRGGFPNPVIALVGFGTQQLRQRFRSNADVESTSLSHYTSRHPPHRTGTTADPSKRQTHPQADKRRKELEPRFGRNSKVQGKINEEQHCMLAKLEVILQYAQMRSSS